MRLAAPQARLEKRADGSMLLRSPQKLGPYARCVTEWLVQWSDKAPDRVFLAERAKDSWRKLTYRETYGAVRRIAQALLERGLDAESRSLFTRMRDTHLRSIAACESVASKLPAA